MDTFALEPGTLRTVEIVWEKFFSTFDAGSKLLDLATGAGHVVRLAIEAAIRLKRNYEVHGVDLADIASLQRAGVEGVAGAAQFHGKIDLNALPFENDVFDGVTSQFGIEYADRDVAIAEAVRVLRRGGRGIFLMHRAGGSVEKACADRLRAHRRVLPDDAIFRLGETVFVRLSETAPPALVMADVARFRAAVTAIAARFAATGPESNMHAAIPFLVDLARTPHRYDPNDAVRRLKFVERDLQHWAQRQEAMIAAALDEAGIAAFANALAKAGATPGTPATCRSPSGDLLAWQLAFEKGESCT
jgi:SAM-dependent methyltransferase